MNKFAGAYLGMMGKKCAAIHKEKKEKSDYTIPLQKGLLGLTGAGVLTAGLSSTLLLPKDRQNLEIFRDKAKNWTGGGDPRRFLDEYNTVAADAAGGKLFGLIDAPHLMRGIRSLPAYITGKGNSWGPGAKEHYTSFSQGQLSGIAQLFKEYNQNSDHGIGLSQKGNDHLSAFIKERSKYPVADPTNMLRDLPVEVKSPDNSWQNSDAFAKSPITHAATDRLISDTQGAIPAPMDGLNDRFNSAMSEFLHQNGQSVPLEKVNSSIQANLYPKFDQWLKSHDLDLWNQKQFTDFNSGAIRVRGAGDTYTKVINGITTAQDTWRNVGIAAAALGAGGLGYLAYRKHKKEKQKKLDFRFSVGDNNIRLLEQPKAPLIEIPAIKLAILARHATASIYN